MKRQSIHFIVLFLYSNYTVRYQIIASKKNSPYHQKNFCFFLKPNSFLIDRISCQGTKNLASTRKKTKFRVVISLRTQVFPITTIRFKNPAKISRFVYSTHSPFNACADKCPLCSSAHNGCQVFRKYSLKWKGGFEQIRKFQFLLEFKWTFAPKQSLEHKKNINQ